MRPCHVSIFDSSTWMFRKFFIPDLRISSSSCQNEITQLFQYDKLIIFFSTFLSFMGRLPMLLAAHSCFCSALPFLVLTLSDGKKYPDVLAHLDVTTYVIEAHQFQILFFTGGHTMNFQHVLVHELNNLSVYNLFCLSNIYVIVHTLWQL